MTPCPPYTVKLKDSHRMIYKKYNDVFKKLDRIFEYVYHDIVIIPIDC